MKFVKGLSIALAVAAFTSPVSPIAAKTVEANGTVPLTITSGKRQFGFKVEVAQTAAEQSRGLMFRTHLGADRGMIFPMVPARFASFWMKNTLIPLDMIFIREDGTIANIAARAVPHSLEPVVSYEPVGAVLEIPGGRAAQLGLKSGDRVAWSAR